MIHAQRQSASGWLSVCVASIAPLPLGRIVVYGTIIPYAQDGVRQGLARSWERHHKAVDDVVADIQALRSDPAYWADAGFTDTLFRLEMKPASAQMALP